MSHEHQHTESRHEEIFLLEERINQLQRQVEALMDQSTACKEDRAQLEAIIKAFEGYIYVCSKDYLIEFMNERLIERTGSYPLGHKCYKALHDLNSVCPWCINERVFNGDTVRWEVLSPKDHRYYFVINTPIYHPDGSVSKMAMISDITQRKLIEEERERLISELEAKNSDLKVLNFAVSHDLRGPLITIKGLMKWVQRDATEGNLERLQKTIDRITLSAIRMEQLIDDLLKLSRAGSMHGAVEEISVAEVAQEVIDVLAGKIYERGVKVEIDKSIPSVQGERHRLLTILQNLVENAVKYMGHQESPLIQVGCRIDSGAKIFYVKDNGIGIDSSNIDKIFELFMKVNDSTEGSGIGLAILKRIIEEDGGRIWVESEGLGKGCTFCFTFDNRREDQPHNETRIPSKIK
ncbi:MAG: ATP-binding protein [Desulfomonilaceae bacterium]